MGPDRFAVLAGCTLFGLASAPVALCARRVWLAVRRETYADVFEREVGVPVPSDVH